MASNGLLTFIYAVKMPTLGIHYLLWFACMGKKEKKKQFYGPLLGWVSYCPGIGTVLENPGKIEKNAPNQC